MSAFLLASLALATQSSVPAVKWEFHADAPILSSPTITQGLVIVGSADSFVYGLDGLTGSEKWKFETGGPVTGSATVHAGVAFVTGWDGNLYALDAATGKLRWKFKMAYERRFQARHLHGQGPAAQTIPDSWDFFTSTPAVGAGRVYFGSGDGNVYAVRESDGKLDWKFKTGDVVHASPILGSGLVYIGSWDSRFYALDEKTGKKKWALQAGLDPDRHNQEGFQGTATLSGQTLYVGCRDSKTYAIDALTGRKKWEFSKGTGWVSNRPLIAGNIVWVGSNPFRGLDATSGALRFDIGKVGVFSSPCRRGDVGYFGTTFGNLFAFDVKSGRMLWEFQTDARRADALKLLDPSGRYMPSMSSTTFGDFQDGVIQMYRRFSLGSILSSPVISGNTLFVGSADGTCYALDLGDQ